MKCRPYRLNKKNRNCLPPRKGQKYVETTVVVIAQFWNVTDSTIKFTISRSYIFWENVFLTKKTGEKSRNNNTVSSPTISELSLRVQVTLSASGEQFTFK